MKTYVIVAVVVVVALLWMRSRAAAAAAATDPAAVPDGTRVPSSLGDTLSPDVVRASIPRISPGSIPLTPVPSAVPAFKSLPGSSTYVAPTPSLSAGLRLPVKASAAKTGLLHSLGVL